MALAGSSGSLRYLVKDTLFFILTERNLIEQTSESVKTAIVVIIVVHADWNCISVFSKAGRASMPQRIVRLKELRFWFAILAEHVAGWLLFSSLKTCSWVLLFPTQWVSLVSLSWSRCFAEQKRLFLFWTHVCCSTFDYLGVELVATRSYVHRVLTGVVVERDLVLEKGTLNSRATFLVLKFNKSISQL